MKFITRTKQTAIDTGLTRLLLSVLFVVAIFFSQAQTLDVSSKQHIDKAFNRALIAFGIAKTLNGVISVAQGTEVAIQPAGIGINLTPGQILDPVNDLVERFSWIMLLSTTSIGIQKIFMSMSVWPAFNVFLLIFLTTGLITLFIKTNKYIQLRIFILRISLLLIILRFIVPIAGLGNEFIYHLFLERDYISSTQELKSTAQQVGQLNENEKHIQPDLKKNSVWESAKEFYNSTSEMLDVSKKIEAYNEAAKESTHHIINLIVIFIFQTIIIPIIFILILYYLCRGIIQLDFDFYQPQSGGVSL